MGHLGPKVALVDREAGAGDVSVLGEVVAEGLGVLAPGEVDWR